MSGQYNFAFAQKAVSNESRPMELTPDVDSAGFFHGYRASRQDADKQPEQQHPSVSTLIEDLAGLAQVVQSELSGSAAGGAFFGAYSPSHKLSCWASEFGETLGLPQGLTSLQRGCLLRQNIDFLKSFRVENVKREEWSPELCYAAAIKLCGEQFFEDPYLPLALLSIPLWIKAGGRTGNQLPRSEQVYTESIFERSVLRNERRSTAPDCGPNGMKFNYIKPIGDKTWQVMGRDESEGGIINGQDKKGQDLLNHAVEVIRHVTSKNHPKPIPKRPRARLLRAAAKLETVHQQSMYRSVCAQIRLRYCEDKLIMDPAVLLSQGEAPINVMLAAWLCSRANLPTIITMNRKKMVQLSPESVWWGFFLRAHATLPPQALLGPGAAAVQALLNGRCLVDMDKLSGNKNQVPFTMEHYETFCKTYFHGNAPTTESSSGEEATSKTELPLEVVQGYLVEMLQASSVDDALTRLDTIQGEVIVFARHIHSALQLLRQERLLREDILAHACNAWNVVLGCQGALARFYDMLGHQDTAKKLRKSRRSICNHFAPDIYPFAHALATCNRSSQGYALVRPGFAGWKSQLARDRANLAAVLVPPLKGYVVRMIQEESPSQSIATSVKEAPTFEKMLEAWDETVLASYASPPAYMEPIPEDVICRILDENQEKRPPVADRLDLGAADLPSEISRYTRTEITKIMCCMSSGGRNVVRGLHLTDQPSAVAMVWAVLRGVDDRDWVQRYGSDSQTDVEMDYMLV